MQHSIRFKLTLLFLVTIVIPVVVVDTVLPSYYYQLMKRQQSSQTEGTLTALTFDIDTYLDDLERMTAEPYLLDDVMWALKEKSTFQWKLLTPYEQWYADQQLYSTFPKFMKNLRQDILDTIILPMDGSVYVTSPNGYTNQAVKGFTFEKQDWYIKALKADGDVAFISVHKQDYLKNGGTKVFSVARLIKDPDSRRPLGVIMADADTEALERIMRGIRLTKGSIAAILDDKQKLIYASSPLSDSMLRQLDEDQSVIKGTEDSYSVVRKSVKRSNWWIVVLLPESVIKANLHRIYGVGYAFAASGLFIALLLYFTISHWMVTPFKQMVKVMKRAQRGDLQTFYSARGNDEIANLGRNLNSMIYRLNELIDREFRAVLGQRNAEYRALQSQIQPHFLYNTLNGFIGLNRKGQSVLLERAILSLSGMLRFTLEQNDRAVLKEEIDFVTKYCELQQMRFTEKMQFLIQVEAEALEISIPKLLLQPIVENAVIHGIEPCDRPCLLSIEAGLTPPQADGEGQWLEIHIADNGAGFNPETNREGVGVTDVRERLQLAYEGAAMNIESSPDRGTDVRIKIPLKEANLCEAGHCR